MTPKTFYLMPSHSYNSVIYASVGANNYYVFLVNQTFVEPPQVNISSLELLGLMGMDQSDEGLLVASLLGLLQGSALVGTLDKLDNEKCIQDYGKMYLSDRSNLLLVGSVLLDVEFEQPNDPAVRFQSITNEDIDSFEGCAVDPVTWMCINYTCEVACVNRLNELDPQNWIVSEPYRAQVHYCLSQPTEEFCKLQFSLPIAMVIILFNFFKAVIMLILAFGLREARVQTMGDAIASFLIQPDHIVNGRCLYGASNFKQAGLSGHPRDLIFTEKRRRFAEADEGRVKIPTYIL
jgi:hypothetical protein